MKEIFKNQKGEEMKRRRRRRDEERARDITSEGRERDFHIKIREQKHTLLLLPLH